MIYNITPHKIPDSIPNGLVIQYVSKQLGLPCQDIFLAAVAKVADKNLPPNERISVYDFARTACNTKNPDIIWQIAYVESGFHMNIINLGGKQVLYGSKAINYLNAGINKTDNIDIGPLQINWRFNGSKWSSSPLNFLKGDFSVEFLSSKMLKVYVNSCGVNWISCYHSYNENLSKPYTFKIYQAEDKLRSILDKFLF